MGFPENRGSLKKKEWSCPKKMAAQKSELPGSAWGAQILLRLPRENEEAVQFPENAKSCPQKKYLSCPEKWRRLPRKWIVEDGYAKMLKMDFVDKTLAEGLNIR